MNIIPMVIILVYIIKEHKIGLAVLRGVLQRKWRE
jgi:hypothetical protein